MVPESSPSRFRSRVRTSRTRLWCAALEAARYRCWDRVVVRLHLIKHTPIGSRSRCVLNRAIVHRDSHHPVAGLAGPDMKNGGPPTSRVPRPVAACDR